LAKTLIMTYSKKQQSYRKAKRKGKSTSRRRPSFVGSLLKVLLPLALLVGVGIFVATNLGLDLESFPFIENKTESNENIIEEIEENTNTEIIEVEEMEIVEEVDGEEVFTVVEEMPRFPGCEDLDGSIDEKKKCAEKKMLEFVYANIKYPTIDAAGFEGMTVVTFIVNKEGDITNPKLLRGGGALGEEYIRVVKSMPQWIPGKQRGKAVNVQFNLPIRMKLEY